MARDKQDRRWRAQRKRACRKVARATGQAVVYRDGKMFYSKSGKQVVAVRGARFIPKPVPKPTATV